MKTFFSEHKVRHESLWVILNALYLFYVADSKIPEACVTLTLEGISRELISVVPLQALFCNPAAGHPPMTHHCSVDAGPHWSFRLIEVICACRKRNLMEYVVSKNILQYVSLAGDNALVIKSSNVI